MTNSIPTHGPVNPIYSVSSCASRLVSTTRTSWMANNAIPDSIIMNMICPSLEPLVELNEPNDVRSNSKNTLRILNTIKPVIRAFTTMDMAKPVRLNVFPQAAINKLPCVNVTAPSPASQVAIVDDKLRSA
jgi:hypothetical protein